MESNVIKNSNLANGTNGWFGLGTGCTLRVETCPPRTLPPSARSCFQPDHGEPDLCGRFIRVTNRTEDWTGPAQMISTEKLTLFDVSSFCLGSGWFLRQTWFTKCAC